MGFTEAIMRWVTHLIDLMGYPGVAFLMMLESMVAPVPSEAVMPFAGCLITVGRFTFFWVAVASTIGSIFGSLLSYSAGYYGGRPFVTRFGRYVLLNLHDLEVTERFFNRHGSITIFISRFIPVIRHLISIPAGVGRMNLLHFSIYTVVGACIWNTFLAWLGYHLGNHWELIHKYSGPIDAVVFALIALGLAYFIRAHLRRAAR
jgi:membrane protein DedA with SNARE-associated domain